MAVLAADANISLLGGATKVVGLCHQADIFYAGAILWALNVGTTGKVSCVPTSGTNERILGFSSKKQTTTAADQAVEYYRGGVWLFPNFASIDATKIGSFVVSDKDGTTTDNYADLVLAAGIVPATGDSVVGMIIGVDGSSNVIMDCALMGTWLTTTSLALR